MYVKSMQEQEWEESREVLTTSIDPSSIIQFSGYLGI